jgi:F-type H+-transporting ATPase subunit b
MQIDWLTVAAQIVNFLILVWLLKRFLYGRVVAAMERRESGIAESLAEAERRQAAANASAEDYERRCADLESQREEFLGEAREEADRLRKSLRDETAVEIDDLRRKWRGEVARERQAFLEDLRRETLRHVYAMARRALGDLADDDLEARMAVAFTRRLKALGDGARAALADAAAGDSAEAFMVSRFPVADEMRTRLDSAVADAVGWKVPVTYRHGDEHPCGLVLKIGGQAVSWTIESYVDDLEAEAEALIADREEVADADD